MPAYVIAAGVDAGDKGCVAWVPEDEQGWLHSHKSQRQWPEDTHHLSCENN